MDLVEILEWFFCVFNIFPLAVLKVSLAWVRIWNWRTKPFRSTAWQQFSRFRDWKVVVTVVLLLLTHTSCASFEASFGVLCWAARLQQSPRNFSAWKPRFVATMQLIESLMMSDDWWWVCLHVFKIPHANSALRKRPRLTSKIWTVEPQKKEVEQQIIHKILPPKRVDKQKHVSKVVSNHVFLVHFSGAFWVHCWSPAPLGRWTWTNTWPWSSRSAATSKSSWSSGRRWQDATSWV